MSDGRIPDSAKLERWLEKQRLRDPELYEALTRRREELTSPQPAFHAESTLESAAVPVQVPEAIALETIVRDGRPALYVQGNSFTRRDSFIDAFAETIVARLEAARPIVDPVIPLIGRIDVTNHPTGNDFLGTGWLVAEDVVITNRHVAELLARRGVARYQFVMGRFGDPITAAVCFGHELDGLPEPSVEIKEVLFIEPPGPGPDIAFLRVDRRTDGTTPKFVTIADADPQPEQDVVVIGYPARARSDVIPDQERMERLYGGRYDIKRAAPGKIDDPSRGWITHDCTTLGGNSGSAVIDLATGHACALHFAGLYLVENYAVPASTLRAYLGRRPWPYRVESTDSDGGGSPPAGSGGGAAPPPPAAIGGGGAASVTIPLNITVSLGQPAIDAASTAGVAASDPLQAARELAGIIGGAGVLAVRPGLVVEDDALRDEACLVVAAHPDRVAEVRARSPQSFAGLPVQVRPASLADQLGTDVMAIETTATNAYDDNARTGPDFRLDWIREPMTLRLHVGPERSFEELSGFLKNTRSELVSAIYQFFAEPIRAAIDAELSKPAVEMMLVAGAETRDSKGEPPPGQFDRSDTFKAWADRGNFKNIFVPEGNGGLINNAYHIKVTVQDKKRFWLSSGNWTRSSQPVIAPIERTDARAAGKAGNREWHVIGESPTLAARFRNHIRQDFLRSQELGGRPESFAPTLFVDVPEAVLEAIALEAAPDQLFEPAEISGELRVKPLLTPDGQGAVYCDAVMELIASARTQLLFQNQYINVKPTTAGRFGALVDALARAAQRVADCRIILRTSGAELAEQAAELKRRGIRLEQIRRLAHTHTKGIIVDGRQVLVGSHNWSGSGVTLNRDASLIIDDPRAAGYFASVFETDWKRASPVTERSPRPVSEGARLAAGDEPPPGFRRIPLAELLEG